MSVEVHTQSVIMYSLVRSKKSIQTYSNFICHCVQSITEEKTAHTRTEKRTWNIKRWRRDTLRKTLETEKTLC